MENFPKVRGGLLFEVRQLNEKIRYKCRISRKKSNAIIQPVVLQIVFDECHRAKNLCPVGSSKPTKTGLTVLELQNRLPKARIVYASATGKCQATAEN